MKKILWIDDDAETGFLKPYSDEFEACGWQVRLITNPDEYFKLIDSGDLDFDLVLVDIMMPTGTRIDTTESHSGIFTGLRLLEQTYHKLKQKSIPVVIFTIQNAERVKKWADDNEVPFLLKIRFDPGDLIDKLLKIT